MAESTLTELDEEGACPNCEATMYLDQATCETCGTECCDSCIDNHKEGHVEVGE